VLYRELVTFPWSPGAPDAMACRELMERDAIQAG
jgi:hypothetical protein